MRIQSKQAWYTLSDFGITEIFNHVGYRGGKIPQWMLKQNAYKGKQLWYKKKLYTAIESTTNTVIINIDGKLTKIHRRDILAPKNTVPVYKQKTTSEIIKEIRVKYPDAKLYIGQGCQLHGDIDAVLTIKGEKYNIPWNY